VGIRQTLNEKPAIAIGIAAVILVAAGFLIIRQFTATTPGQTITKPVGDDAFYSDDDGATYFTDSMKKITPIKSPKGKDAVRARVYRCGNGAPFVGYLERHTPAAAQNRSAAMEMSNRPNFGAVAIFEIKRPKDKTWVPMDDKNYAKAIEVMGVTCPGDPNGSPVQIYPGQQ